MNSQTLAQTIARNSLRAAGYNTKPTDDLVYDNPVDFIEQQMYIPELREPMPLQDERGAVLREMSRRVNDAFQYQTWLFSMTKKSAKTSIGAGVALWQAWRVDNGEIYIIGNDQKQADNRMAQAIRYCVEHNELMRRRVRITSSKYTIKLANGTRIESIPVDPRGEAGMNPTGLFQTEAWGAIGQRAELMWTEAALSPTRLGDSFKFLESYAGFNGESLLLERLYEMIVKQGSLHPTIPELYTNGQSIAYWCTRRYLPWQTSATGLAYYRQEALEKTPQEFERIHENKWTGSSHAFVPISWFDECRVDALPPVRGVIVGIDAGVHDDCFAVVVVSKDSDKLSIREVNVWQAQNGGVVPIADVKEALQRIAKQYRVECFAYDEYQLAFIAQELDGLGFWEVFSQAKARAVADKQLYDLIRERRIQHTGEPVLREHILNADSKPEDDNKLRLIKRSQTGKIDAVVALSMACDRALYYNF